MPLTIRPYRRSPVQCAVTPPTNNASRFLTPWCGGQGAGVSGTAWKRKVGYMIMKARRNEGLHVQAIEVVDHGKDVIVANYLRIE